MSSNQLIPIETISKVTGLSKVQLAYLTKLRLLPQTIRRKIGDKIAGCYPESVLTTVSEIENLRDQGLSYAQIRYELRRGSEKPATNFSAMAFLIIGLVLGYMLAVVGGISSRNQTALPVAAETSARLNNQSGSGQIYLIALPDKNLYKLGQIDLNTLIK